MNINPNVIECPVCFRPQTPYSYISHISAFHPEFLMVLFSIFPTAYPVLNYGDTDTDSYEYLSELCERIGNVSVPTDPDVVSCLIENTDEQTCPVCFEIPKEIRLITVCNHTFCHDCIKTWLSEHKTCPVCKVDTTHTDNLGATLSDISS